MKKIYMFSILIKKLSHRTLTIINSIISISALVCIASLILCLIIGIIGKLTKFSFMTSLAGFFLLTFLITTVVPLTFAILILISFIIDSIKAGMVKILLKSFVKTFVFSFVMILVIKFIKHKNLQWIESLLYSLPMTACLFFKDKVSSYSYHLGQEMNVSNDEVENNQ